MSGLLAAWLRSRSTSARRRACSSSQRRLSSSKRAKRSLRASWYVSKPAPCTQTSEPVGLASRLMIFSAAWVSSSRSWETNSTVLRVAFSCSSSHRLPGTSR